MAYTTFADLVDRRQEYDGTQIAIRGVLSGSLIESMGSDSGLHMILLPGADSGLAAEADDLSASRVRMFYPGDFAGETVDRIRGYTNREISVEGIYSPEGEEDLGSLRLSAMEF